MGRRLPPCAQRTCRYTYAMHDATLVPDDLEACQHAFRTLSETHARLQQVHQELADTCTSMQAAQVQWHQEREELQATIQRLLRQLYGRRGERWQDTPGQQHLNFGEAAAVPEDAILSAACDEEIIAEYLVRRRRRPLPPRSEELPPHLERRRERIEPVLPPGIQLEDCEFLGLDVVETLQFERGKVWVRRLEYPKYKLRDTAPPPPPSFAAEEAYVNPPPEPPQDPEPVVGGVSPAIPASLSELAPEVPPPPVRQEPADVNPQHDAQPVTEVPVAVRVEPHGILQAPREPALIAGGRYGFGVATEILFNKFVLHVPLYRQQDMWTQAGWSPSRSTLVQIVATSAELLRPLAELLRRRVLASPVLGTDDSPITLLTPRVGEGSRQARFWCYRGRDTAPYNVFAFTDSRAREGPDRFLETFTGTLTGDCYSGYVNIEQVSGGRIRFAACVAHARRKIFEAREQQPLLSSRLLALFGALYDLEDRARPLDDAGRLALRQREGLPAMARLRAVLDSPEAARVLPKSRFGEALAYLRNHWEAFQLYLRDGRLPIDNNEVEREMRRVALARKNWLFLGSEDAGDRTATILSVISSAHRHDLDVWAYLRDVLEQLARGPRDLSALLPDIWKAAHAEHVRTFRAQEKEDRAAARRYHRAKRRQEKQTASTPTS